MLSLADARKTGKLRDFIAQEEERGIGPVDRNAFDTLAAALIKAPQSEGQTSRSACDDNSSGTKIPQDNDPYASR